MFETFSSAIDSYFEISHIPGSVVLTVAAILAAVLLLRRLFSVWVIAGAQRLASRTQSSLDDELVAILRDPLAGLIVLAGIWFAYILLSPYLRPPLAATVSTLIELAWVLIIAWIIFRSAGLMAKAFARMTSLTTTELDDLLAPYVPLVVQVIAVLVVVLKIGEVLLGVSAAALIGLLGGAGITIGLVFRDVLSDWFATIIIYLDKLYRPGDLIEIHDGSWAYVDKIGLRSTTIRSHESGIVQKMPNSRMVRGDVANRSQSTHWGVRLALHVDGLSSDQSRRVAASLRRLLQECPLVHESEQRALLRKVEGNTRIFSMRLWMKRQDYYAGVEEVNLALLALLQEEGIDPQTYSYSLFQLRDRDVADRATAEDRSRMAGALSGE